MTDTLKRIFDLDAVRFEMPTETQEQEVIFVNVVKSINKITQARALAMVSGSIMIFSDLHKMPYGYLSKKIAEADPDDTKNFFFSDFEENKSGFPTIAERSMSFVYFFDSQYNPDVGTITSIDLQRTN